MAVYISLISTLEPDAIEDKLAAVLEQRESSRLGSIRGGKIIILRGGEAAPREATNSFALRVSKIDNHRIRVRLWRCRDIALITDFVAYVFNGNVSKAAFELNAALSVALRKVRTYSRGRDRLSASIISGYRSKLFYLARDAITHADTDLRARAEGRRLRIDRVSGLKGGEALDMVLIEHDGKLYHAQRLGDDRTEWWISAYKHVIGEGGYDSSFMVVDEYSLSDKARIVSNLVRSVHDLVL